MSLRLALDPVEIRMLYRGTGLGFPGLKTFWQTHVITHPTQWYQAEAFLLPKEAKNAFLANLGTLGVGAVNAMGLLKLIKDQEKQLKSKKEDLEKKLQKDYKLVKYNPESGEFDPETLIDPTPEQQRILDEKKRQEYEHLEWDLGSRARLEEDFFKKTQTLERLKQDQTRLEEEITNLPNLLKLEENVERLRIDLDRQNYTVRQTLQKTQQHKKHTEEEQKIQRVLQTLQNELKEIDMKLEYNQIDNSIINTWKTLKEKIRATDITINEEKLKGLVEEYFAPQGEWHKQFLAAHTALREHRTQEFNEEQTRIRQERKELEQKRENKDQIIKNRMASTCGSLEGKIKEIEQRRLTQQQTYEKEYETLQKQVRQHILSEKQKYAKLYWWFKTCLEFYISKVYGIQDIYFNQFGGTYSYPELYKLVRDNSREKLEIRTKEQKDLEKVKNFLLQWDLSTFCDKHIKNLQNTLVENNFDQINFEPLKTYKHVTETHKRIIENPRFI